MSDLLPCPFCEAALVWSDTYGEYHHPVAKCILSGHKFKKGMIMQWNRRALPAVQPDPREAALREALAAVNAKWRSGAADTPDEMRGLALAEAAIFDLLDKPGKDNSHA